MSKKKDKKEKNEIEMPLTHLHGLHDNLSVINNYSAGIGYVLGDSLKNYNSIIASQSEALDSIVTLTNTPAFKNISEVVNLYEDAISPLSSVIADIGVMTVGLEKLRSVGNITTGYIDTTQNFMSLALDSINNQQMLLKNSLLTYSEINFADLTAVTTPNILTVSSGLSEMLQSLGTYPVADEEIIEDLQTARVTTVLDEEDLLDHQNRLDALLSEIDPELVSFRVGVWSAFDTKAEDYIGQASSSMRRLVDHLLRALAPEEEVKESEYYKNTQTGKGSPDRPTRKARVFYIVDWDAEKASHLERLTKGFLEAYDNLSAWDHIPLNKDGFVHGALIAIEGHLLSILSVNRGR